MTVFYEGPDAWITDEVFRVARPGYEEFAIRELDYVHVVERQAPDASVLALLRTGCAGLSGAASTALIVTLYLNALPVALLASAGVVVSAGAWWAFGIVPGRTYELWAVRHGMLSRLYVSIDPRSFGQVRRALQRAIEHRDDHF